MFSTVCAKLCGLYTSSSAPTWPSRFTARVTIFRLRFVSFICPSLACSSPSASTSALTIGASASFALRTAALRSFTSVLIGPSLQGRR